MIETLEPPILKRTIDEIITMVCRTHYAKREDLTCNKKTERYHRLREYYAVLGRAAGYSYPELGDAIGKHHTTILLAYKRALGRTAEAVAEVV